MLESMEEDFCGSRRIVVDLLENVLDKVDEVIRTEEAEKNVEDQRTKVIPIASRPLETVKPLTDSGHLFKTENFLVGCKWAPDGTCVLTNSADNTYRLFDLPREFYSSSTKDQPLTELSVSLKATDSGLVYDYDWYPFMSSWDPATSCFVSASSNSPVHLFDAFTGVIRASYLGYNMVDEITSAYSVKFSSLGDKIYCGYVNQLNIFDVAIPGRTCDTLNTKALNDQTGILSCVAENPAMPSLFAVGSYRRTIGMYTRDGDGVCLFKGHRGGVTQLLYTSDGLKLFSGARMDDDILCWDLRNPGAVYCTLKRTVRTNQRIQFTLTPDEKHLISGNTDGSVSCWDITGDSPAEPSSFQAHKDCVNGISINRHYPILATASGQKHFPEIISDEEDDNVFTYSSVGSKVENKLKLWWVGEQTAC